MSDDDSRTRVNNPLRMNERTEESQRRHRLRASQLANVKLLNEANQQMLP
jgi:hypothetical protein